MSDLWVRRLRERLGFRDQPAGVPETGRGMDNVVARRWRSRKHEDLYLNGDADGRAAQDGISLGREFSSGRRLHQALGYRTPRPVWLAGTAPAKACNMMDNAAFLTPSLRRPFHRASLDGTFGQLRPPQP